MQLKRLRCERSMNVIEQGTLIMLGHARDGRCVFKSASGNDAADTIVGREHPLSVSLQSGGDGDGAGGFTEDAFLSGELCLDFPDGFVGDEMASSARSTTDV